MRLSQPPEAATLLLRTDYSDDAAWQTAVAAATAVYENLGYTGFGAALHPVESPELDGLTPADLVQLPRDRYVTLLAVADAQTMRDHTVVLIDLNKYNEQVGRTFRVVPVQLESILVNLDLANMDFFTFADSADPDGVFRGFRSPDPGV